MTRERQEYIVTHRRTIEVVQSTMATSAAEAIRKFKNDTVTTNDTEWIEWEVVGKPVAYKARLATVLPGENLLNADEEAYLDQHLALMDEQRDAAGPQDDPPW